MGRLDTDGICKYCNLMQDKVTAGRADMKRPLRRYLLATVGLLGGAYLFRIFVYAQNFSMWTDLERGDLSAIERFNHLVTLNRSLVFVIIGACLVQGMMYRRWLYAGNANALSRTDIGLRWIRTVPSAKALHSWRWGWVGCIWASVILAFVFRAKLTDFDTQRTWNVVQIIASVGLEVTLVGYALAARRVTAELMTWLDSPMPEVVAVAEPEPIA